MSFASLIEEVQQRQPWAGATVKTLLNRLMHKGLIKSIRDDGRQLYHPQLSREAYVVSEVQALADRLYGGRLEALLHAIAER